MKSLSTLIVAALVLISGCSNLPSSQIAIAQPSAITSENLLEQGKTQYSASEFNESLSSFQKVLKIYEAKRDVEGQVEVINYIGRSYNAIGRYQQAIDAHKQALKLIQTGKNSPTETVRTLTWLGDASLNLGNEEKGLNFSEQAIALVNQNQINQNQTLIPLADQGEALRNLGRANFRVGQFPQALKILNQALIVNEKSGDRSNQGKILNNLANVYIQQGDFKKGLEYAEKGLKLNLEAKNEPAIALSLFTTGSIYGILGQTSKSLELLQQSSALYKKFGDRLSEADLFNQVSNINNVGFQFAEGVKLNQRALAIYQEYGDQRRVQDSLESIGSAYANVTEYAKSLDFYQQALKASMKIIDPELSDRVSTGKIYYRMAEIYGTQGKHLEAISFYEKATAIYAKSLDVRFAKPTWRTILAGIYRGIGDSYGSLSQYPKSLLALQQSTKLYQQAGDRRGEIVVLLRIAPIYQQLGQADKYAAAIERAKVLNEEIKLIDANALASLDSPPNPTPQTKPENKPDESSISNFQPSLPAKVLQNLEDLESLQRDLEFFKKSGNRSFTASTYSLIGAVYSKRDDRNQALNSYQEALKLNIEIGDRNSIANSWFDIGLQYALDRKELPAYTSYQKSLRIYKELGNRNQESQVLSSLGVLLGVDRPSLAIAFYKQSVNTTEAIRKELKVLPKNQQQAYQQKITSTYRSLADLLLRQGRIMEALQVLDLLKVQELQDYLQNVKGNERTAQGIRLLEPEKAIASLIQPQNLQPQNLDAADNKLTGQIRQLPKSEINRVPTYLQNLPSGVVLLYPLILSDRIELIMFSANNPPINRTVRIKQAAFEELVKDFRSDLQNTLSLDVKTSGKKVYDLMIKPIAADLKQTKATTILYAPDGILRYIPLAALYDGKQWLVEQYQVNNLIAYSLLNLDRKPPHSRFSSLRIFAGAFGGKEGETRFGTKALPATIAEVENISKTFANSNKFVEQKFTAKNIKSQLAGNAIVHLATHALFNTGSPLESYILFGDGTKVSLAAVNEWQLKDTELVVLSACETGVGTFGTGAEILGFGYQVQRAGAKAAIASLWTVSDSGTQLLMKGFYQNLQTENVSSSLRNSQLALIKRTLEPGKVNFNHPFFWSSFILVGNSF